MRRALLAVAMVLAPVAATAQFNLNLNKIIDTGKNIREATRDVNEKEEAQIGAEYAAVLLGASPLLANPEEVKKLAAFAASRGDAEKFAAGNPQLKTQKIDYLQAAK